MSNVPVIKEYAELKAFADAQTKTIVELSRKLNEKDQEILHLKKLLEGSVPLIREKKDPIKFETNDQEYICRTEINKLRDISIERELTFEECKKLDIYSKILKDLQNVPKTIEIKARTLTDAELLAGLDDVTSK